MTISFNQIPSNIGVPGAYVEFNGDNARTAPQAKPVRILVYGQMLATGTATPNVPILVSNIGQAIVDFGRGSMLADMLGCHFKVNALNEVYVVPQIDQGTVKAVHSVTYTGNADEVGVASLYIGGRRYTVPVSVNTSYDTIAEAMVVEINADLDATFTASSATESGILLITARHAGELGNDLQINSVFYRSDSIPLGIGVTYDQTVQGAVNPDVADSIAATASGYYTDIIFPYTDEPNMALIEAELEDRWAPLPNETSLGAGQNDAHLWTAFRGTQSEFYAWKETRNNRHVTVLNVEPPITVGDADYVGAMSPVWIFADVYGATGAYYSGITPNGNLQNIAMGCLQPAPMPSRFTWNERNQRILNGGATYKYDGDGSGNGIVLERATTTYTQTINGTVTDAERDTETQKLNSYLRWSLRQVILSKYGRHRLANDGNRVSRQQDVTTPLRIKATIVDLAGTWADLGYIENYDQFKRDLRVERSVTDCNTVNALLSPDHVNQFRVFAGQIGYIVC